jgi:uncharacterized delta-60 repeat protein
VLGGTVGGADAFGVVRLNTDGTLDNTFSDNGTARANFGKGFEFAKDVSIQEDGKIILVGWVETRELKFAVARFSSDGTADTSFSGNGRVTINFDPAFEEANAVAVQPGDGKILIAGTSGANARFAVARFNPDGTLDPSFSGDGKASTNFAPGLDEAEGIALQPNGKILLGGGTGDFKFGVARFNPDGSRDTSFGRDGRATVNFTTAPVELDVATEVRLQGDRKIVLGGIVGANDTKFALARFNRGGGLDRSFSGNGKARTNITEGDDQAFGLVIQPDDKLILVGTAGFSGSDSEFALVRYEPDGGLDESFGGDGQVTTNFTQGDESGWDVALQDDGKIVMSGGAGFPDSFYSAARYLPARGGRDLGD